METNRAFSAGRIRRLTEELEEEGLPILKASSNPEGLLEELDYAMRPPRHERRVPSYGSFIEPAGEVIDWEARVGLSIQHSRTKRDAAQVRRYSDGLSSWTVRQGNDITALMVFDRSAGSERDMVILSRESQATLVQRHPSGTVRIVGQFGLVRWDGMEWHREPPIESWLEQASCGLDRDETDVLEALLRFAVYDLGARGVGALIVFKPVARAIDAFEDRLAEPPPLDIRIPAALGPLHHVLTQIDGAAVFDESGILRLLGIRLVPSAESEHEVAPMRGTRHTAARRFSHDDPEAIVIAVSEDGPVTLFRNGKAIGQSGNPAEQSRK